MIPILQVLLTVIVIALTAFLIIKKHNSVFTFLGMGIIVLLIYSAVTGISVMGDKTCGNVLLDVILFVESQAKTLVSGMGLIIMTVTGYAVYMTHIGASTKLAQTATKPLRKLKNPYIVLSFVLIVGCVLKLVITSASGLSILFMATAFPILISLGVSKVSAAVPMVLVAFLDWGPNDSSAIFASTVSNMEMMDYFLKYQAKVGVVCIVALAVFLPIYLARKDKKDRAKLEAQGIEIKLPELEEAKCPLIYIILPLIPLLLVAVFSFVPTIKMSIITANYIGFIITFILELIRTRKLKELGDGMLVILKAMGTSFANIVSIIIAASVFAQAIIKLNGITVISNFLATLSGGVIITMIAMSLITFFATMLLGSGNASWYAFGPLLPDVCANLGIITPIIAVPMQLATSIGRCVSPVAGAVLAVAGMAEVDLSEIIKRTMVPAVFSFVVCLIASYIFTVIL